MLDLLVGIQERRPSVSGIKGAIARRTAAGDIRVESPEFDDHWSVGANARRLSRHEEIADYRWEAASWSRLHHREQRRPVISRCITLGTNSLLVSHHVDEAAVALVLLNVGYVGRLIVEMLSHELNDVD